jgi:hypothetical protein
VKTLFPYLQKFTQAAILHPEAHKSDAILASSYLNFQFSAHANGYIVGKVGVRKHVVERIATPLGNLQAMLVWVEDQIQ